MKKVELSHGGGGLKSLEIIKQIFFKNFSNPHLDKAGDGAHFGKIQGEIVTSTDGHVVSPLIFSGGNIGSLAFCGTINDLAAMGATPHFLTASFILEEGLDFNLLETVVETMGRLSSQFNIPIIAGDTKVVEKGKADQIYISVSGVGSLPPKTPLSCPQNIKPGQSIYCSGFLGDHGATLMLERHNLEFQSEIQSDCRPLHLKIEQLTKKFSISAMRDPTRGGMAGILNELALQSQTSFEITDSALPFRQEVLGICEVLGLNRYELPSEGQMLFFVDELDQNSFQEDLIKTFPDAKKIGVVVPETVPRVKLLFDHGGERPLSWPLSQNLPRIC